MSYTPAAVRISLIFGCAFLFIVPASCSSPPETPHGKPRLVFKHSRIVANRSGLTELLQEFEQQAGIEVRDEEIPSSTGEQHQFYVINLEGGSAPFDVLSVDIIWIAEFAQAGWISPLPEAMLEGRRFFPSSIAAARYKEQLFAVPWYVDAGLLYYRADLLAKHNFAPPQTWEDLKAAAKTIAAAENIYGYVWEAKQGEGLVCTALEYMRGAGGGIAEDDPAALNSAENEEALAFMRSLIDPERISPPLIATLTEESARQLFAAGRAVFMRNWPYAWPLLEAEGSALRGKVGVAPLPRFGSRESVPTLGGWYLAVNKNSPSPAEALALVDFLSQPHAQKKLALSVGYQPGLIELYNDPEIIAARPSLQFLPAILNKAAPRPVTPYYLQISEILQPELSAAVVGRKKPAAALRAAARRIEFILREAPPA